MFIQNNNEKFIDLQEVCNLLQFSDTRSAHKWCNEKNIAIQIIGKKRLVHRFLVDMEIDKHLVSDLKNNYPDIWEELYRCYQDNDRLGYLILLDDSFDFDYNLTVKQVKPQSRFAKNLANS